MEMKQDELLGYLDETNARHAIILDVKENKFIPLDNPNQLASGYDVRANITELITLNPNSGVNIPVGFKADFMRFNEMIKQKSNGLLELDVTIRPKSSWSKRKIYVMLGTIDVDFQGESECHIINLSKETVSILPGQKIGQMVFGARISSDKITMMLGDKKDFTPSNRGENGFGSSGSF